MSETKNKASYSIPKLDYSKEDFLRIWATEYMYGKFESGEENVVGINALMMRDAGIFHIEFDINERLVFRQTIDLHTKFVKVINEETNDCLIFPIVGCRLNGYTLEDTNILLYLGERITLD